MQVNPGIFKAYDIRGVYGDTLFDGLAVAVGKAFAVVIKPETVIVGRDGRISSPIMREKLIEGLTSLGVNVLDIGMVSTDIFYFACAEKKLPGIMVTASHNPKEYNGFKMVKQIPYLLTGDEGIQEMRRIIVMDEFPEKTVQKGEVTNWVPMDEFIQKMLSLVKVDKFKPGKVFIDTANGMVGPTVLKLFEHIPQLELVPMYFEPDGNFPNHGGDPLQAENRQELEQRVANEEGDFGFAFDPDGDRFFTVDKKGRFVAGDFMTAILAKYFLAKYPGSPIVYDIRASWAVPDTIIAHGGKPLYNRVGHSYIKKRLMDEGAVFGGEVTGHYYFKDFYNCDSGIAPMLFLLELLSASDQTLDQMVDELEKTYFISGEVNSKVEDVATVMQKLEDKYATDAKQIIRIDGVTMEYDKWKFNVRSSNTEPLLRLNVEAKSRELMEEKRDELLDLIRN